MTPQEKCRYAERRELEGEIKRLKAERDRMKHVLNYMICYEPKEVCKDEFAYDRLLSNFKEAAEAALREG